MLRLALLTVVSTLIALGNAPKERAEVLLPSGVTLAAMESRVQELESNLVLVEEELISLDSLALAIYRAGVPADSAFVWALYFIRFGREANVDPWTLAAMAYHESGFDARAVNPNDPSYGLMQIMPRYWRRGFVTECGGQATPRTLYEPRLNICYGAYIAAHFQNNHPGNPMAGITAYNNGSGRLNGYARRVMHALGQLRSLVLYKENDIPDT